MEPFSLQAPRNEKSAPLTENLRGAMKGQVENALGPKTRILAEVGKPGFPDLAFLFSDEALAVMPAALEELLERDKRDFAALLAKPLEHLTFEDVYPEDPLRYLFNLLPHLDSVKKSETSEKIVEDFQPKYAAFQNEVWYDRRLYEILIHLRDRAELSAEQRRLVEKTVRSLETDGINLSEDSRERLKAINVRLSELSNDFSNNLVKSKKEFGYLVTDFEVIKDLPKPTLDLAKSRAEKAWKQGHLFDADPTAHGDILSYCSDSGIREAFAKAKASFASSWEYDNRPVILEILRLKEEKAKLLWHANFAELSLVEKMADSPKAVFDLLGGITERAKRKAYEEVAELKAHFHLPSMEYWDVGYYETRFKQEKHAFDEKALKAYFEYEGVRTYLFEHARNFYGVEMRKTDLPVWDADVCAYEAYKDGKLLAYYVLDPFYSEAKSSGAWANNIRGRGRINGTEKIPLVWNVCNFQKSESGPTLLAMIDVRTLFHEFGHALHEILSESEYSALSGFNVEWDFVELPSQLNENWMSERGSLEKFARHYQTGESIPSETLDTLDVLKTFMSGLGTLVQNTYALLDMNLHSLPPPATVEELDRTALALINDVTIFPKGKEFKMHASFGHIFSSGYSAGFYSYMWAELLEADVFAKILELGMFDRNVGESFIRAILGQGTRKPAVELFRDFMGRDLDSRAFMERKGF